MVEISVITPVWNKSEITNGFLFHNWNQYKNDPAVEFVIVDNASSDNTPATLKSWKDKMGRRLVLVRNEKNLGFGGGHNRGKDAASGEILIFLSNDVLVFGDYAGMIKSYLDRNPEAMVGPELFDFDTGWNKFNGKVYPYLAGWCIATTRATWDALGGWDERFYPCDYEDLDLSCTASELNVPIVRVDLPLKHSFGQSAAEIEGGRLPVTLRNQQVFIDKWKL